MIAKYEGVALSHDERPLLSGVTFEIEEGDFIYIMGEVGSGKTSLLRSIYGELPIQAGEATVLDTNLRKVKPSRLPRLRKQLGIVFQDFQLLGDRTVQENLDFVLRATGWKKKAEREQRIADVLEQVGLPEKAGNMPYELSGGEQQRVCIARAMLNSPKLLLADEPTANLDVDNGRRVMQLLADIRKQGTTVMMSTHNLRWIDEFHGQRWTCKEGTVVIEQAPLSSDLD